MLNHVTLMGRLTRDPELRYTNNNTPVASFTIAVDRDFQEDGVDFIDCVGWKRTGEFVSKYFQKGQMIVVSGSLQSRKWKDRDGNNRINWEVVADRVYFGEAKRRDDGPSRAPAPTERGYGDPNIRYMGPGAGEGNPFTGGAQQSFDEDDGELPF